MFSRLIPLLLLVVSPLSLALSPSSSLPQIRGQLLLSNHTSPLDLSTQITLGGKQGYSQLAKIYGSSSTPPSSSDPYHFKFTKKVPNGDYVLRIESRKYEFQSYFVRVSEEGVQTALFDERYMRMYPGSWLPHPLMIRPIQEFPLNDLPPASMSLVTMLKSNPLIWLIGLGLIMVVAIPKLMENLDPETLREVQESQKEMQKNMASLQSFDSSSFSKFLSGAASTESARELDTPPPAPAKIQASASTTGTRAGGGGGGKGKKRK